MKIISLGALFLLLMSCSVRPKAHPQTMNSVNSLPEAGTEDQTPGDKSLEEDSNPEEETTIPTIPEPEKMPDPVIEEPLPNYPAPVPGPGINKYHNQGELFLDMVMSKFRVGSLGLYAEAIDKNGAHSGGNGGASFLWPATHMLRAIRSAAMSNPGKYSGELKSFITAIEKYHHGNSYAAGIMEGQTPFFDDNAILSLALGDVYRRVGADAKALEMAKISVKYCLDARDAQLGVPQLESELGTGKFYSQATMLPALSSAILYQITKDEFYLKTAVDYYAKISDPKILLRADSGLYNQFSFFANNKWSLVSPTNPNEYGGGYRAYQSTPMVQLAALLYKLTGEPRYLNEARTLTEQILNQWYKPGKGISDISYWGGSDIVEMLLDLYEIDPNPKWLKTSRDIVDFLLEKGKDKRGFFASSADDATGRWDLDRQNVSPDTEELMGQAAAATAILRMGHCEMFCNADVAEGTYKILNSADSWALSGGAKVGVINAKGSQIPAWKIARTSDGYYTITLVNGLKNLALVEGKTDNGTQFELAAPSSSDAQKFFIVNTGDNLFRIVSKAAKTSVDRGVEKTDGTPVYTWSMADVPNQYWRLFSTAK